MRYAGPVRREIGVASIMNLLGPLANPAGAMRQLIGVNRPELTETFAGVLAELGAIHVMVVHGGDGLDELTLTGPSRVTEYRDGQIRTRTLDPRTLGLELCEPEALKGGDGASPRAAIVREILDGKPGPKRSIVELNAAAALIVGGCAEDFAQGLRQAKKSIDSGAAKGVLAKLVEISNAG
jgi:anthranilate phosphoribosyltransferase